MNKLLLKRYPGLLRALRNSAIDTDTNLPTGEESIRFFTHEALSAASAWLWHLSPDQMDTFCYGEEQEQARLMNRLGTVPGAWIAQSALTIYFQNERDLLPEYAAEM